jgi:poly(3-hydroxybutyrate) depolymerase
MLFLTVSLKSETISFQVTGKARSCTIHVPSGINKPAVVFFFHGAGGSGANFENDTKADVVADREKFIAAYPSGISGNWNYNDGSDDFKFILALIDTLDTRYHIDRNRLYVTGFSMGGGMTFALACKYSDVFAAAAPVSAAGTACTPKRKIPLLLTFGTNDMNPAATYMAAVNRWVGLDGCPSTPEIIRPYPASNAQSKVTRLVYKPCADGAVVMADSIQGGGHEWPTDAKTKVNNSEEVWAFFKNFSLNATAVTIKQPSVDLQKISSAVYNAGSIGIRGVSNVISIQIIDTKGRLILSSDNPAGTIPFAKQSAGIYYAILKTNNRTIHQTIAVP